MDKSQLYRVLALHICGWRCAAGCGLCLLRSHSQNKEEAMAKPDDTNNEKGEMRIMWIASAAIVLLILVAMGINMMITHDTSSGSSTEPSNHAAVLPPK
jgi:hypothetical protein